MRLRPLLRQLARRAAVVSRRRPSRRDDEPREDGVRRATALRHVAALASKIGHVEGTALRSCVAHNRRDREHGGRRGRRRPAGTAGAERQLRHRRGPCLLTYGSTGRSITVLTRGGPGPLGETPIGLRSSSASSTAAITAGSSSRSTRASGSAFGSTPCAPSTSSTAHSPKKKRPRRSGGRLFPRGTTLGGVSRAPAASGPVGMCRLRALAGRSRHSIPPLSGGSARRFTVPWSAQAGIRPTVRRAAGARRPQLDLRGTFFVPDPPAAICLRRLPRSDGNADRTRTESSTGRAYRQRTGGPGRRARRTTSGGVERYDEHQEGNRCSCAALRGRRAHVDGRCLAWAAQAAFPGQNGRIVFNDQNGALVLVNANGTGLVQLATHRHGRRVHRRVVLARRQAIAYSKVGHDPDIFMIRPDGSDQREITFSRG